MRDLFGFITKHRAQTIILDYKLKPFIPDFIPAVGDIDAFLKVQPQRTTYHLIRSNIYERKRKTFIQVDRPDMAADKLGLTVIQIQILDLSDLIIKAAPPTRTFL